MRLPGTRYQEHGWEHVRKMLGRGSLQAFARLDPAALLNRATEAEHLALYVDLVAEALHDGGRGAKAEAPGNSYGESVFELSLTLLYELQARPADWSAFCAALGGEYEKMGAFWLQTGGEAILRKKVNDMFAVLRDKVDSDNYQAACGRPCSANKMYTYRMLDTAYGDIARLFGSWHEHREQVAAILGRTVDATPIEARQMKSIGQCKAEWVIRWSESLERFGDGPGPLHTRSKRFASLKNNPAKIGELMAEIGDYEELSSNRDQDWLLDASEATEWLEDLWRVVADAPDNPGDDRILPPPADDFADADAGAEAVPDGCGEQGQDQDQNQGQNQHHNLELEQAAAASLSLPLRFMQLARDAQDRESWTVRVLEGESLPVRLAVYLKMLGSADDTYPGEWLDPATGELPTMAQLAVLDALSLPTLRKRRDAAIARLMQAAATRKGTM